MNSRLLVFAFLLVLFASFAAAVISSQRALDYVTKENYFLYENESAQVFPTVKVKNGSLNYWMVAVSSGEAPVAYVPVLDKTEIAVPENSSIQRALFKTSDVLWYVSKFKERLSSQDQWFFSTGNASFFSNLSLVIQNEPFELESIKTDLADSKASLEISLMNSSLASMSKSASELSAQITGAIVLEQAFASEPDTNRINFFKQAFDDAFEKVKSLDEEIIQYNASITRLKKIISESSIDASKKNQLLSFANAPQQLLQVSSKAVVADSVKQAVDSAFSQSITRSKDLVDNLALRIKRNKAALAMKALDEDFKGKTGKFSFSTLDLAAATMLSADYSSEWKNQERLASLNENYSQAKSLFEKGDYDLSMSFSTKAKTDAIAVLRDGFREEEQQGIDWTLWIYFAVAIIIVFIIIFVLRNRGKFSALIQQQESREEEVGIHGWEKR